MSKIIATAAIRGAHAMVARAEEDLQKMIKSKGKCKGTGHTTHSTNS